MEPVGKRVKRPFVEWLRFITATEICQQHGEVVERHGDVRMIAAEECSCRTSVHRHQLRGDHLIGREARTVLCERDTLFAAAVSLGRTFTSGAVGRLFSGPYGFDKVAVNYDVAADGQHFLVPRGRVDSAPRQLELVLNWFEELNRLAPK